MALSKVTRTGWTAVFGAVILVGAMLATWAPAQFPVEYPARLGPLLPVHQAQPAVGRA